MKPGTVALHILLDCFDCDRDLLQDQDSLRTILEETATENNLTVLNGVFHRFEPHGVSGVLLISESHISIHTWPEHDYAAVDVFSCRPGIDPNAVKVSLEKRLHPGTVRVRSIVRGERQGETNEAERGPRPRSERI
jgi:S-adenosylmethionine decarboxylase proenzyme